MDPQKIIELANLLKNNGDKILNSEFTLTLSGSLLRALNDAFTLITDAVDIGEPQSFQVVKPNNSKSPVFRDLQLIYDFVQKTALLCIVHYPTEEYFEGLIDISKFRALKRLEVQKTSVKQIIGIQRLRSQLQQLICVKSLQSVDDIITHCGGDKSNGFVWNELKIADFSYNNLKTVDTSLEFAQYLQHLNLRHNQLQSVEAIKWLPNLKTLDLSYNCLPAIPQFHMEACKRLQSLNMSNNFVEDLIGIAKLDALTDLDLSDNCLLDHSYLLPLSALMTLKFLNLYGNPLYCHPKHRLATAQFLHKNTATVKFILDFEPLSKNEKAITGSQQMRPVGSLSRFTVKSSTPSINSGRFTPISNTPSSSIGSLRSFKFQESSTDAEANTEPIASTKRKSTKMRTVEIEEIKKVDHRDERDLPAPKSSNNNEPIKPPAHPKNADSNSKNTVMNTSSKEEHLEAKKHVENLREKFGEKWLQSGNAEMLHSALGLESNVETTSSTEKQREVSRQLFDDYLGEFSMTKSQSDSNSTIKTSTPNDSSHSDPATSVISKQNSDATLYKSLNTTGNTENNSILSTETSYKSANETDKMSENIKNDNEVARSVDENRNDELEDKFKNVYSTAENEEPEISGGEDDEETYIVYTTKKNEALFLTLSSNFLREKDTLTQKTKTKWSLKILESCDRIKSNTLRINFDTVKLDKQERVYTVEDGLCHELEKKLRNILSQRDLSEMNQIIYRCVNCSCQFSIENKFKQLKQDVRCPDCKSTFVAEVHEVSGSLDKVKLMGGDAPKLSPAVMVEESPITTPLILQSDAANVMPTTTNASVSQKIGITESSSQSDESSNSNSIGSANSLNDSSSCTKITPTSQSSFDSNQSVAGSSNTERDLEFNVNESDVDIISNPSQSSIEVLDSHIASRKTSEERRISQHPTLETIDDTTPSYTHSFIEREFQSFRNKESSPSKDSTLTEAQIQGDLLASTAKTEDNGNTKLQESTQPSSVPANATVANEATGITAVPTATMLAHLTESSSSGSVTDSICTAYEQQHGNAPPPPSSTTNATTTLSIVTEQENDWNTNLLATERENSSNKSPVREKDDRKSNVKKEENGLTSMFGALFQSTNVLMSSSKKLLDAELRANVQQGQKLPNTPGGASVAKTCAPYKFNYQDFNDIDHRLKLYFYQTKFEDAGEHFKWIVRGRVYNENTRTLYKQHGIIVMSTSRLYIMEEFAPEHDDVTKWLKLIISCSVDRLEWIQLLPWKLGLTFSIRDFGNIVLLLQDIIRTDSLLLYFTNNNLPQQCEIRYQPAEIVAHRLNSSIVDEKIKICAILNSCEISCDNAKRTLSLCTLLTTDSHLYLSTGRMDWLSHKLNGENDNDLEICLTQLISNLVDVNVNGSAVSISFLDETQNKSEFWNCDFETKEIADSCLNAIGQSWQELFGVPLFNT